MQQLSVKDIMKQVKRLQIGSRKLSDSVLGGEFHSAFKGRGMMFKEVREYTPGDDPRFIDWNTSARLGHTYSKVFEEERDLNFLILIDVSASGQIGAQSQSKREYMITLAANLAWSALAAGDKTGMVFFSNKVEKYIPPKQGKQHFMEMIAQLVHFKPTAASTNIEIALKFTQKVLKNTSIIFLLSDFESPAFDKPLKSLAARHDCVALHVYDKFDIQWPSVGLLPMQDAETGELVWIDTSSKHQRHYFANSMKKSIENVQANLSTSGWDYIRFRTDMDSGKSLKEFLTQRIRRRR